MNKDLNSIGLDKKPSDTTVVVAMSGGVDSSTVAGIMKKEGYNVIGITLKLYDDGKEVAASKQCCSGQDIMDAKRVAHKLAPLGDGARGPKPPAAAGGIFHPILEEQI